MSFKPQMIDVEIDTLPGYFRVPVTFPEPLRKALSDQNPNTDMPSLLYTLAGAGVRQISLTEAEVLPVQIKSVSGTGVIRGNVGLGHIDEGLVYDTQTGVLGRSFWAAPKPGEDTKKENIERSMFGLPPLENVINLLPLEV